VSIGKLWAEFSGELDLLRKLQDHLNVGDNLPEIRPVGDTVVVRYSVPVPEISTGVFVIRNASVGIALTIPAGRWHPVARARLRQSGEAVHADRARVRRRRVRRHRVLRRPARRMEVSLDFGASVAVAFVIAKGEAHVLGGIRFELVGDEVKVTGFLRIGGSLEILG